MPHGNYSFLFELHRIGFVIWSRILLITKTPILSFTCFAANKLFLVFPKNNLVSLTGGRIIGTFAYFPAWLLRSTMLHKIFFSRFAAVVRDDVGPAAGGGGMQYPQCFVLLATIIISSSSVNTKLNSIS